MTDPAVTLIYFGTVFLAFSGAVALAEAVLDRRARRNRRNAR